MTEVTPNLPHCGNFCKYCFMGTLLFTSDHFIDYIELKKTIDDIYNALDFIYDIVDDYFSS